MPIKDDFYAVFRAVWSAFRQFRDKELPELTRALEVQIEALFECMDRRDEWEDDIELKRLVLKCDEFRQEWDKWVDTLSSTDPTRRGHPQGSSLMWRALDAAHTAFTHPIQLRGVESPKYLSETGVSHRQIAKMMEWFQETDGQPDSQKVAAELYHVSQNGGRHQYWSPEYIPPSKLEEFTKIEKAFDAWLNSETTAKPAEGLSGPEAPESIEDLLLNNISVKQILKMKSGVTEEEILAVAKDLGIAPTSGPENLHSFRHPTLKERVLAHDEEVAKREARAQVFEDPTTAGDLIGRIVDMAEKGRKPGQIAKELQSELPGTTWRDVKRMLDEAKQEA